MPNSALDTAQFNRIARRNVTLPLVVGLVSAGAFVVFFLYFLSVPSWVDHTHQVIGKINELTTLEGDMEAGLRGFLLTGDDTFLAPYQIASPSSRADRRTCSQLDRRQPGADRPAQARAGRCSRHGRSTRQQHDRAEALRRRRGGRRRALTAGKQLVRSRRAARSSARAHRRSRPCSRSASTRCRRSTWLGIGPYVLFIVIVNCYIAWAGRRDINQLSQRLRRRAAGADRRGHACCPSRPGCATARPSSPRR